MREVTKEEFYSFIGRLNVHPQPTGQYPYTVIFKTPVGQERGRIVPTSKDLSGYTEKFYLRQCK